ncbi:MAG TPA: VOC family protein [Blastocatellia bacterium]|nr:VOC family protein [Blastocatellia bacterium]
MLPIRGVYEVAIRVKNLFRSEKFYLDVLDLEVGLRDERRNWLFLKAGGDAGMVVLQEDKGEWPLQHFAFTIEEGDIESAAAMLREKGVEVEGPVVHQWMGSTSLYFEDPDGNQLELLAVNKSLNDSGAKELR